MIREGSTDTVIAAEVEPDRFQKAIYAGEAPVNWGFTCVKTLNLLANAAVAFFIIQKGKQRKRTK